jgi:hypothetical protein
MGGGGGGLVVHWQVGADRQPVAYATVAVTFDRIININDMVIFTL